MNDRATGAVTEPERIPIVRDPTFVRFVADQAAFTPIGRDVEISFLQMGVDYHHLRTGGEFDTFENDLVLNEVARVRMNLSDLLSVAMNFLRVGIVEGQLKGEAIRGTLDKWITEAANREVAGTSDE